MSAFDGGEGDDVLDWLYSFVVANVWWIIVASLGMTFFAWLRSEQESRTHELAEALLAGLMLALATYPVTLAIRDLEAQERIEGEKQRYLASIVGSADLTGFQPDRRLASDLSEVHLRGKNLRFSNFEGLNLERIDASFANLEGAEMSRANFRGADLRNVYMRGADLTKATLAETNLVDSDLRNALLHGADLSGADIRWADFRKTYSTWPNELTNRELARILGFSMSQLRRDQRQRDYCLPEDPANLGDQCGRPARELWEE